MSASAVRLHLLLLAGARSTACLAPPAGARGDHVFLTPLLFRRSHPASPEPSSAATPPSSPSCPCPARQARLDFAPVDVRFGRPPVPLRRGRCSSVGTRSAGTVDRDSEGRGGKGCREPANVRGPELHGSSFGRVDRLCDRSVASVRLGVRDSAAFSVITVDRRLREHTHPSRCRAVSTALRRRDTCSCRRSRSRPGRWISATRSASGSTHAAINSAAGRNRTSARDFRQQPAVSRNALGADAS